MNAYCSTRSLAGSLLTANRSATNARLTPPNSIIVLLFCSDPTCAPPYFFGAFCRCRGVMYIADCYATTSPWTRSPSLRIITIIYSACINNSQILRLWFLSIVYAMLFEFGKRPVIYSYQLYFSYLPQKFAFQNGSKSCEGNYRKLCEMLASCFPRLILGTI